MAWRNLSKQTDCDVAFTKLRKVISGKVNPTHVSGNFKETPGNTKLLAQKQTRKNGFGTAAMCRLRAFLLIGACFHGLQWWSYGGNSGYHTAWRKMESSWNWVAWSIILSYITIWPLDWMMEDGIEDMFLHLLSELNSRFSESQDIVCRVCSFLSMNTYNIMCYIYIYVKWSKWHPSSDQQEADLGDFCQSLRLLGSMDKLGMTCLASSSTSFQFLRPFQSVVSNELACCKALSNMANLIDMMRLRMAAAFWGDLEAAQVIYI